MGEAPALIVAGLCGAGLGALFFGGLWWTLREALSSERPALWFVGSLLLRMSVALAGFYLVSGGHWQRLVACALGFFIARAVVTRLTRSSAAAPAGEASHGA